MQTLQLNWKLEDARRCLSQEEAEAITAGYFSFTQTYPQFLRHLELVSIEPICSGPSGRCLQFEVTFVDPVRPPNTPDMKVKRYCGCDFPHQSPVPVEVIRDIVAGQLGDLVWPLVQERAKAAGDNQLALQSLLIREPEPAPA